MDRRPSVEDVRDIVGDLERLQVWIGDLQSGMYVNCVYCGHRYGPGETTPVSMADALKAHIEKCPEHPMSKLRAEVNKLNLKLDEADKMVDRLQSEKADAEGELEEFKRHCRCNEP